MIVLVDGMVLKDGFNYSSHFGFLLQISVKHQSHQNNHILSFQQTINPSRHKHSKKIANLSISLDIEKKWKIILHDAEKELVENLRYES